MKKKAVIICKSRIGGKRVEITKVIREANCWFPIGIAAFCLPIKSTATSSILPVIFQLVILVKLLSLYIFGKPFLNPSLVF